MHPFALLAALRGRLRALFRRDDLERDLDDEIRFHLEMEVEKNLRRGMGAAAARRMAMVSFGGVARASEAHRRARGTRLLEDAFTDLHYARRALTRTPGFVAVSIITLGVAIAVGTSLFTAVNGFFYRSLPVPGGGTLVSIFTSGFGGMRELRGGSSYADMLDFAAETRAIAEITGEARITLGIGAGENVAMVPGAFVPSNFFPTLRVTPSLGRFPTNARFDAPTIVLGYALWRRMFASDASVVGRSITVNGQAVTVAAVAPPEFLGTLREVADEFWIDVTYAPLLTPNGDLLNRRGDRRFHLIARLRDGASIERLETGLGIVATRLVDDDPAAWRDTTGHARRVTAVPERQARMGEASEGDILIVVGGVIALGLALLALASTNLASMQMARTAARRREIATRLALGAGRGRLVRQLVAECVLIAVPGALLGLALASAVARIGMRVRPAGLPNVDMSLDMRALLFTAAGLVLALLVFGLMPALQSVRSDVVADLKGGEQPGRTGIRVGGVRGGLIVAQVALSVMFTAASGLVALAIARHADDSLVDGERVLVAPVTMLPAAGDSVRVAGLIDDLLESLDALPAVDAVSAARFVPIPGERVTMDIEQREPGRPTRHRNVDVNGVRPHYFAVTGVPILRGRDFEPRDMTGSAHSAIVSKVMADSLWPGEDPLGKRIYTGESRTPSEIIGIVGELRDDRGSSGESASRGLLYLPFEPEAEGSLVLHVRTSGPALGTASDVARILRRESARLVISQVTSLDRYMERAVMPARIMSRVSGVLAGLQLLLAIAGLSGLVAYITTLRRREIGIRAALGADRGSILALVMRQGVRLSVVGGIIGIGLSLLVAQVIATVLPMNATIELRTMAVAALGFIAIAGAAMLVPASRALSVTPATALRVD